MPLQVNQDSSAVLSLAEGEVIHAEQTHFGTFATKHPYDTRRYRTRRCWMCRPAGRANDPHEQAAVYKDYYETSLVHPTARNGTVREKREAVSRTLEGMRALEPAMPFDF